MSINFDKYSNIISMFFDKSKKRKNKPYLWIKNNGVFKSLSWEDVELSVKSVARSLLDIGILKG
ncbi:MAG: long-chain fatty acid--CoA ligase, partial [Pelagibacteraceae bacterium]|nr:long-chain fatty acid--CoA ligase [Pelagibacteraceae bacterium]